MSDAMRYAPSAAERFRCRRHHTPCHADVDYFDLFTHAPLCHDAMRLRYATAIDTARRVFATLLMPLLRLRLRDARHTPPPYAAYYAYCRDVTLRCLRHAYCRHDIIC